MSDSEIEWHDSITPHLERILAKAQDLSEDAAAGAEHILEGALLRVPKESESLAASGRVNETRAGANAAAITFDGPYARWIHEHLFFKHPHGGEAKYLERAMLKRRKGAVNRAFSHFWERL